MSNQEPLLPCPFCGALKAHVAETIAAWNRRASRPSPTREEIWPHGYNSCLHVAIQALNHLSSRPRPIGGQDAYNAEHLLQIADEIKRTIAHNIKVTQSGEQHASDCAVHNGPALPAGPCDCKQSSALREDEK